MYSISNITYMDIFHSQTFRCLKGNLAKPLKIKCEFKKNINMATEEETVVKVCGLFLTETTKKYISLASRTFKSAMAVLMSFHVN